MSIARERCVNSMMKNGFDVVWPQNPDTVSEEFKKFNQDIFEEGARGAGCYWLFKPYIIYRALLAAQYGDILVYSDAGVEWINSVRYITDRMDQTIFFFTNTHPNHHWTKQSALDKMMPGWENKYQKDTPWPQVQASVIFFKVCPFTVQFVKEWLIWCQMPDIINDKHTATLNDFYQDHRHDQSVLTFLATRHNFKLHWWATAYAEHIRVPGDDYPVLFNHHRKRNHEWTP